jgi:RNA polymerase sigma factor (sigma-70 family)
VAQEAFVRALVRWRALDDPVAYLFTTAFRHQRRRRARTSRGRDLERLSEAKVAVAIDDTVVMRHAVRDVLDRLTRRQRECAVLSLYLGFTTEEVADLLGVRPSTVRVHLHAARTSLASMGAAIESGRH